MNKPGLPRKLPEGESALNDLIYRYARGARERNIDFILTREKFKLLTSSNCHYCGAYPRQRVFSEKQLKRKRSNGNYVYNGIDRRDNSKGYYFENCIPCCTSCNYAKHTKTYDEFIAYLNQLVKYRAVA